VDISRLDGKRIAIVLELQGKTRVLRGSAKVEQTDSGEGRLRIRFLGLGADDGHPELLIEQVAFGAELTRDTRHGCDYLLRVEAGNEAQLFS
jgi:hypothetical protein